MPDTGSRHPRPAFVEDWDDDAQTTLSSSRATANVAVKRSQTGLVSERAKGKLHDGSDSGYSSKAPTVGSASTSAGKMAGLKVDTSLQERERHPYLVSANGATGRRETFTRPSAAGATTQSSDHNKTFVHPKGICMTCDLYGYHVEVPRSVTQPPTPISPKLPKKSSEANRKAKHESEPQLKRLSSHQRPPPAGFAQPPAVQPAYSADPYVQTGGWNTPITPLVYTYTTPLTSTYVGPAGLSSYFEPQPPPQARPPKPERRSSQYGEPVIQQLPRGNQNVHTVKSIQKENRPVHSSHRSADYVSTLPRDIEHLHTASIGRDHESRPTASVGRDYDVRPTASVDRDYQSRPSASIGRDYDRPPATSVGRDYDTVPAASIERSSDNRPAAASHRSSRSIEQDKRAMPPPERPKRQAEATRRPSLKKVSTYNPEIVDYRRSHNAEEYNYVAAKVPPSPKARDISPSRPPTSYRGPSTEEQLPSRPQPSRKSVSYSDPVATTKLSRSDSTSKNDSLHRSTTVPSTSMEQKAADAEEYQRSRSKMTSEELTAEKLNDIKRQRSNTESSQTGSAYSHRESHQSSSRGSSGRGRSHTSGHRTSILIDKAIKLDVPADYEHNGRPLSIELGGGMTLSFGSKDKDKKKETKMIEKAPSVASHVSKKSTTSASYEADRRHESTKSSRRPSHNDDDRRPPVTERSSKSSRQHSRAPSTSRSSQRHSVDYSGGYSAF
jgi:hypothetical protein